MIKQNQNIEKKIFQLQNEYLNDNSNSGNSTLYLESIREYIKKLSNKEEEINAYKKQIRILNMKLKEKENEILKKNELLKKYIIYYRERETNTNVLNNNNDNLSHSAGKKAKSLKNHNFQKISSSLINNNYNFKDDINRINIYTNKYSNELNDEYDYKRNDSNLKNNYIKLLDNYNDLKKKYNYYYKISHNFKLKINSLNEDKQKLMKNINLLTIKNNNLNKLLAKYTTNTNLISFTNSSNNQKLENPEKSIRMQNKNRNIINNTVANINPNNNNNNVLLLLNSKNGLNQNKKIMSHNVSNNDLYFNEFQSQPNNNKLKINLIKSNNSPKKLENKNNNDLISDDEMDESCLNNNKIKKYKSDINNKATKKIYDAFEKYRELYNKKEKEYQLLNKQNQILKSKIEEQIKIIKEKDLKIKEGEKTIESQNSLNLKLTEYFTMIDELETANKKNNNIINENKKEINKLNDIIKEKDNEYINNKKIYEDKIKNLEINIKENQKLKINLLNNIEKLNNELKKNK